MAPLVNAPLGHETCSAALAGAVVGLAAGPLAPRVAHVRSSSLVPPGAGGGCGPMSSTSTRRAGSPCAAVPFQSRHGDATRLDAVEADAEEVVGLPLGEVGARPDPGDRRDVRVLDGDADLEPDPEVVVEGVEVVVGAEPLGPVVVLQVVDAGDAGQHPEAGRLVVAQPGADLDQPVALQLDHDLAPVPADLPDRVLEALPQPGQDRLDALGGLEVELGCLGGHRAVKEARRRGPAP